MTLSRDQVLGLIRDRMTHPASVRELMQVLKVPREERTTFRRHLKQLAQEGHVVQVRGHRYGLPDKMDLIVGRLTTHPNGFGFVAPERTEPPQRDVFVAPPNLKEAMHGDRVVVRIERVRDGRAEGRIVRILSRANSSIVGRYNADAAGLGFVSPFDERVLADLLIPRGEDRGAKPGEMVVAEITTWPTATRGPVGRVVEVLGDVNRPGVDTRIIIRKYGLPDEHAEAAVSEARRLTAGHPAPRSMAARRRDQVGRSDFRDKVIVTIDGEHARDFDDAISLERLPDGHYWLGVHIADVSFYVREGSALDSEAYERGTSVYFPERALHMFPDELATGLCSLNPRVDRLVQSCFMEVDRRGEVVRHEFHDGIIHTRERMTYTDVNAILTREEPVTLERYQALVPLFELMRELFLVLNDRRRRRGSIDFDLEEPEVVLDEAGMVEAIIASERNIAHRIIEEFMLLANQTVASYLEESGLPALYRVHEDPDPLKVEKFEQFVSSLGYSLAAPPNALRPGHFQALVERLRGKPEEKPIALLMLRTMQRARYETANLGHFGLAFDSYTHFTSPIRRYPDLVVHRLLRAARRGLTAQSDREDLREDLPEVARHCSETERRAEEAERELVDWKKVRFMADKIGDEFDGYVTGVTSFGLFVELIEHFVEGLVHMSTMADDYYRFVEDAHTLRGVNTRKVYRLGDRVHVQVLSVDLDRRQVGLGLVEILETLRREERRGRKTRARTRAPGREREGRAAGRRRRPPRR
jgi:ribonuclease R